MSDRNVVALEVNVVGSALESAMSDAFEVSGFDYVVAPLVDPQT
jgi:hypothetical protein